MAKKSTKKTKTNDPNNTLAYGGLIGVPQSKKGSKKK